MRTGLAIAALGAAAIIAGVASQTGKDKGPVESVDSSLRVAYVTARCDEIADRCPGGTRQLDSTCECVTRREHMDHEVDVSSVSATRGKDFWVCQDHDRIVKGMHPRGWHAPMGWRCRKVCEGIVRHRSQNGVRDRLVACLERECSPCQIDPISWGRCPDCLLLPGGCASVCRESDSGIGEIKPKG